MGEGGKVMNFFTALMNAYNAAEKIGLVDKFEVGYPVLLPLFHNGIQSNGKNIIEVCLDTKGQLIESKFIEKGEKIIFPVTSSSMNRTSKAVPHLIADTIKYLDCRQSPNNYDAYINQLSLFMGKCHNEEVKEFLNYILIFIRDPNALNKVSHSLESANESSKNANLVENKKPMNNKIMITFAVENFKDGKRYSVSSYKELHQEHIKQVLDSKEKLGTCNLTGEQDVVVSIHRSVAGTAKLIPQKSHDEMYKGRFKVASDVVSIGQTTSEKAHLMLKYLMESPQSKINLGENQFFINWFSDDIKNESKIDLTKETVFEDQFIWEPPKKKSVTDVVSQENRKMALSFIRGKRLFNDASSYYGAIINKVNDGRASLTYFRELRSAELLENLEEWQKKYSWPNSNQKLSWQTPALIGIVEAAYGIETDSLLTVRNKKFKNKLLQELIVCLLDKKPISRAITKQLELNIRNRHKYEKEWYKVEHVALSVLKNQGEEQFSPMLDEKNVDRSYLYGRLLAVFELLELESYKLDSESKTRIPNAQRYWAAYTGQPAKIMRTLFDKTLPYAQRLQNSNRKGIFFKLEKERQVIIEGLSRYQETEAINLPLDFTFIFGYYAEKKYIITRNSEIKNKEEEK